MKSSGEYIHWFSEPGIGDVPLAGGKNASLGEMYRQLTGQGIRVPNGFAVTAEAYRYTLERGKAWPPLRDALDGLNPSDVDDLARRPLAAREIIYGTPLPDDLARRRVTGYRRRKKLAPTGTRMKEAGSWTSLFPH